MTRWREFRRRIAESPAGPIVRRALGRQGRTPSLREQLLSPRTAVRRNWPTSFPASAHELAATELLTQWWYYSVELLPGISSKGIYPDDFPLLPRLALRYCDLTGSSCLDLGSMEGLLPVLMSRGGASRVLATDAIDHCSDKLAAVRHYYDVNFDFRAVGLAYDLDRKLRGESFDVVNCSGLLYHVASPMHVLAGVRPLLKRDGLLILSTNVFLGDRCAMEFNDSGRLQAEANTFWYLSVRLLEYLLRYFGFAPVDCFYHPHALIRSDIRFVTDLPSGYLTVVCRAKDRPIQVETDDWMQASVKGSWEFSGLCDWESAMRQPTSSIRYKSGTPTSFFRSDADCIDLHRAVAGRPHVPVASRSCDSNLLRLEDRS